MKSNLCIRHIGTAQDIKVSKMSKNDRFPIICRKYGRWMVAGSDGMSNFSRIRRIFIKIVAHIAPLYRIQIEAEERYASFYLFLILSCCLKISIAVIVSVED